MSHVNMSSFDQVKRFISEEQLSSKSNDSWQIGSIEATQPLDEQEERNFGYRSLKYLLEETDWLFKPKLITWGRFKKHLRIYNDHNSDETTFHGFSDLALNAHQFISSMPNFYVACTDKINNNNLTWELKSGDCEEPVDIYFDILEKDQRDKVQPGLFETDTFKSTVYHSTKAHWLMQSLQKDGLWNPITVTLDKYNGNDWNARSHPGSIRSLAYTELDNDDFEIILWDNSNFFEDIPTLSAKELVEVYTKRIIEDMEGDKLTLRKCDTNVSFLLTGKRIEIQSCYTQVPEFRPVVYEHSKKTHKLFCGKPLSVYIGYDSRHEKISEVCKKSIEDSLYKYREQTVSPERTFLKIFGDIDIHYLDTSKIPEYTREYANQSTEFTYSRFLIPYLENYEGFSIFVDNDFIFNKSLAPLFYYLNYDDALACVQYKDFVPLGEKFNGEKNVAYPKKLWSSLMLFNNAHEDCKKLTPEAVNTWTGKQLHQFEWTDKISKIPERYILTEGYDTVKTKPRHIATHFTRGGPWIKDMDISDIQFLESYTKILKTLDG